MAEYLLKDTELDQLVKYKDEKTRLKLYNLIKSRGDSSKTAHYRKSWKDLKEWLRYIQKSNEDLYLKRKFDIYSIRAIMCDMIASKMDDIDKMSQVPTKNTLTIWFVGQDCKKCHSHIYTDGNMDWCSQDCPNNAVPASWRE